jgi:hypothetical protein
MPGWRLRTTLRVQTSGMMPHVKITDLINATTPPAPYSNVRVGTAGSCLDMIILGKCVNPQCTFSHAAGIYHQ